MLAPLLLFGACRQRANVNYYTLEQDIQIGKSISEEIEAAKFQYPILPERGNEELYRYVRGLKDRILATGKVANAKEFAWQVKIIRDKEVQNAFCLPGGYIYIFTGLIQFLDSEDQLAGVMGHEIAHAANRHATRQWSKAMPAQRLADALLGKGEGLKQLAVGLASLKFSRSHETEADDFSVQYLCGMNLNADGSAGFFKKIEAMTGTPPEWLSTHPSSKNRVQKIEAAARSLGCTGTQTNAAAYQHIKNLIP